MRIARFCLWLIILELASLSASAATWVDTRRTGTFTIRSEVRLEQFVGLLRIIEQQQADVAATLDLQPTAGAIEIHILASRRSFSEHVAKFAPEGVNRRALFIKGEDGICRVFLYVHDAFEIDLRHESTHAVLHSMLPFLPLWLDEGLAEYFEVPAEDRASNNPHQVRLKWPVRLAWRPNLRKLEAKTDLAEMDTGDYRESWAWVHYLLHGPPEATQLLKHYLQQIQAGQPPGSLSDHLLRLDPHPERRLISHLKSWK